MLSAIFLKLITACVVGTLIGIKTNPVAIRMFTMVCTGSALLTIVSTEFFKAVYYPWFSDPGRLSAQVIAALGFLGTGLIWISSDKEIQGLPAAASLWLTAILGLLIGSGLGQLNLIIVPVIIVAIIFWFK